jgi:transcriptional regulator with XRE-family HTH domain
MQKLPSYKNMLNEETKQFNIFVGQKIKSRRLELKKTQSWLAKKIGVTFQQVQKYEKGSNGTNLFNLKQIADALQVSVLYFFIEEKPLLLTKEMEITNDQSASG